MITGSLGEIAAALAASAPAGSEALLFGGATTDSRRVGDGNLFVALAGERVDGHDYVAAAAAAGAVAAIVERPVDASLPQLLVPSARAALGTLARFWVDRWRSQAGTRTVLAVTGSNGKTTVKNMLAAICGEQAPTHATPGNFNNDVGLPLTVFALSEQHRYLVLEMGANHVGEIAHLCTLVQPDLGIVTQVAPAHLEGFGSVEGVARAKSELLAGTRDAGVCLIDGDGEHRATLEAAARGRRLCVLRRGTVAAETDAVAWDCEARHDGSSLRLTTAARRLELRLSLLGEHNALNAAFAAAAALALDIPEAAVAAGLAKVRPAPGRLELRPLPGLLLVDDSYNANPASLEVAMAVLATLPAPRILVLGDMGELGEAAASLHRACGARAAAVGIDALLALGPLAAEAATGFGGSAERFQDVSALTAALRRRVGHGPASVLVKGSRAMQMERVVAALEEGDTDAA